MIPLYAGAAVAGIVLLGLAVWAVRRRAAAARRGAGGREEEAGRAPAELDWIYDSTPRRSPPDAATAVAERAETQPPPAGRADAEARRAADAVLADAWERAQELLGRADEQARAIIADAERRRATLEQETAMLEAQRTQLLQLLHDALAEVEATADGGGSVVDLERLRESRDNLQRSQ